MSAKNYLLSFAAIILAALACAIPSSAPQADPNAFNTMVALTSQAAMTQTAAAQPPTATTVPPPPGPSPAAPPGGPIMDDDYVIVSWTIETPEDETIPGKIARRRQRLQRLLREAAQQGGVPTQQDLADALLLSIRLSASPSADQNGGLEQFPLILLRHFRDTPCVN